eukprot:980186-Amphidinium_carterae.3
MAVKLCPGLVLIACAHTNSPLPIHTKDEASMRVGEICGGINSVFIIGNFIPGEEYDTMFTAEVTNVLPKDAILTTGCENRLSVIRVDADCATIHL